MKTATEQTFLCEKEMRFSMLEEKLVNQLCTLKEYT